MCSYSTRVLVHRKSESSKLVLSVSESHYIFGTILVSMYVWRNIPIFAILKVLQKTFVHTIFIKKMKRNSFSWHTWKKKYCHWIYLPWQFLNSLNNYELRPSYPARIRAPLWIYHHIFRGIYHLYLGVRICEVCDDRGSHSESHFGIEVHYNYFAWTVFEKLMGREISH